MNLRDVIDAALEVSVVGSYSRIGPAIRGRLYSWTPPSPDVLAGRTILITGPTSGLGRAAADGLAALGARLLLVGRDEQRLTRVRDDLVRDHGEDRFPIVVADMGSLASVHGAVERIVRSEMRLDAIVDNAGAIFPERSESPDGIEATLAVLVVGPFALIAGLLPLLGKTPRSRVIAVTSGGMYTQALRLDDLQWQDEPFSGPRAYARAKRAQTTLMREWSRRLAGSDVSFSAMHPGWADTRGLAESLPRFYRFMHPLLRSAAQGADTIVWLASATDAAGVSGKVLLDRRPRPFDRLPRTRVRPHERRRLWHEVVRLAGIPDPAGDEDRVASWPTSRATRAARPARRLTRRWGRRSRT